MARFATFRSSLARTDHRRMADLCLQAATYGKNVPVFSDFITPGRRRNQMIGYVHDRSARPPTPRRDSGWRHQLESSARPRVPQDRSRAPDAARQPAHHLAVSRAGECPPPLMSIDRRDPWVAIGPEAF